MKGHELRSRAIVAQVWAKFRPEILARVAVLEQAAGAERVGTLDEELQRRAERAAHMLAGSLGSLGLGELTSAARAVEHHFDSGSRRQESPDIAGVIRGLRDRIESVSLGDPGDAGATASDDSLPTLLIVDSSKEFSAQLAAEAALRRIHTRWCSNAETARILTSEKQVDIVLLDTSLTEHREEALHLLADLTSGPRPIPVLVFASSGDLPSRVEVASLGGRGFLKKPVDASFAIEFAAETLRRAQDPAPKVLVVDDDPVLFEPMRQLLEPHGIRFVAVDDPRRFWDVLEAERPDLLVLDVDMPHMSGLDLCRVLRNDRRWNTLPVLFLSAPAGSDMLQQMFAAGADDYVSKPMVGPEFVTRILNRLERSRLYRTMAETDSLTGTSTRLRAIQVVGDYLRMADRYTQPVCLTIIDLDRFKDVNDRHGHAVGDQVLGQFGRLLFSSFRGEDIVARWGGEEFLVAMYGMHLENASQRLNGLLEEFSQIAFSGDANSEFRVNFSAGISEYPTHGMDLHALYRMADRALYAAKAAGRGRVITASRESQPTHT